MRTLFGFLVFIFANCGVLQCGAKKVISSRLEYMEYTIDQYQLGLIPSSYGDSEQSEVALTSNQFDAESMTSSSSRFSSDVVQDAASLSSESEKRHVGPFNRTPLLSRVDGKGSRADDSESDELSVHYEFNKTLGAYVIFHRSDDKNKVNSSGSENETDTAVDESLNSLTSNSFDASITTNTNSPSSTPTNKYNNTCPSPYNPLKVDYISGSLVEVNGYIFICNDEPYTKYCNYPTFDEVFLIEVDTDIEEVTNLWLNAWQIVGECKRAEERPSIQTAIDSPTFRPTAKPSFRPTTPKLSGTSKPFNAPSNKPTASPVKEIIVTAPPKPSNKPTTPPSTHTPTESPTFSPTSSPSHTPTLTPSYSPSTWSPTFHNDQSQTKCLKSQTRIRIELLTDGFPGDTSWVFKRKREKGRNGVLLIRSHGYNKVGERDTREVCMDEGTYEFIIRDVFSDGLCCEHGTGYYKISSISSTDSDWQLVVAGAEFVTKEIRHSFKVHTNGQLELVCQSPQRKIRIEIQTDNFGEDTSWQFRDQSGVVIAKNERVYGKKELDARDLCLDDKSLYEFIVFDHYGDGLCCQFGQGSYKIISYSDELFGEEISSSNGIAVLYGGMFFEPSITHTINTTSAIMSERDYKWLEAHNIRRRKYHTDYGQEFVPLQWSEGLKAEGMFIYFPPGNCTLDFKSYSSVSSHRASQNMGGLPIRFVWRGHVS
jgi:hypothetical protein